MIELLKEYIPKMRSGEFFRNNLDALMTPEGMKQVFLTAILTGLIFMFSKVFGGDSKGMISAIWYWFTGFICTGIAHVLFQILTGLPLKIF
ncbi:hypothetical protein [Staphylococcus equorum]|uniref:hypothetical protein n=1 Tax=Staphylococcus equorum TaxID=246432 RepID=UPI003FD7DE51